MKNNEKFIEIKNMADVPDGRMERRRSILSRIIKMIYISSSYSS